jgi:arylsulfatase A-like enzyme
MTTSKRPNLVLVLVDQMRYHAMGCAGNYQIKTPRLDRMAAEGACMDTAVSSSPVCTPARACLLTGRYPLGHTTVTNNSMLPPDMPSMAKMLKAEGYDTGYIGKWHLAGEGYVGSTKYNDRHGGYIPPGEMRHGFDYWAVHHCSHKYYQTTYYRDDTEAVPIEGWEPDAQTDLAIEYVRDHAAGDKPFFFTVSPGTPHTPFISPEEYRAMYDPAALHLRENVEITDTIMNCDSKVPEGMTDPEEVLREFTANYYAAVTNLDWNMGRLMDTMEKLGIGDNTLFVFTSDHGDLLGSHGMMHKTVPYDESYHIPFLIRYPDRIGPGLRTDEPFGLTDALPTLFSLMGVAIPDGVEGADLAPLLLGETDSIQESAYISWPCNATTWGKKWVDMLDPNSNRRGAPPGVKRPYRAIRTRTHTYARDLSGPWLLFDNQADPYQQDNLVGDEGSAELLAKLDAMLDGWLEQTNDTFEDTPWFIERIDLETGLFTN